MPLFSVSAEKIVNRDRNVTKYKTNRLI